MRFFQNPCDTSCDTVFAFLPYYNIKKEPPTEEVDGSHSVILRGFFLSLYLICFSSFLTTFVFVVHRFRLV